MATRKNLNRLCADAYDKESFGRIELKDEYGFKDADFSVLKKQGLLVEIDKGLYTVCKEMSLKFYKRRLEEEILRLVQNGEYDEIIFVLEELFGIASSDDEVKEYNYILFLLSQAVDLLEPWRHIAMGLSIEDILTCEEGSANSLRIEVFEGFYVSFLERFYRLLRSGMKCDVFGKIVYGLVEYNAQKDKALNSQLVDLALGGNFGGVREMLENISGKRKLTTYEYRALNYARVLESMKKYRILPKLGDSCESEESLFMAGNFKGLMEKRKDETRARKTLSGPCVADVILVRINREIEGNKSFPRVEVAEMCKSGDDYRGTFGSL